MATLARQARQSASVLPAISKPTALFLAAAIIILGGCATSAALGHWLHQPNRDLWQHTAALRALIADIRHPTNPFVATSEPSRQFHPYWVFMALLARTFGWTVPQTIGVASYLTAGVLGCGFYFFGRAYFRSEWGPLALILCCTLAWSMPISHTGYINIPTLDEGAGYPAPMLVGLSMLLWALVINSFERPRLVLWVGALAALMFSTHQLGAGLGFIVALCLAAGWPGGSIRLRVALFGAIALGIAASTLWIYMNPMRAVMMAGNPTWRHGINFYTPKYLIGIFVPSAVGVVGLVRTRYAGKARPLLIAFVILLAGYVAGDLGFLVGTRFAATAAMMLQIGIATILVPFFEKPEEYGDRFKLTLVGASFAVLIVEALLLGLILYPFEYRQEHHYGNVRSEAAALSGDIPDNQEVAAYDVAAWPLAAVGQKVLSVPWPEPFISDLTVRQRKVDELFDLRLSREQRVALGRRYGVRSLVLDERFGPNEGILPDWTVDQLRRFASQARRTMRSGPMWRFDLY